MRCNSKFKATLHSNLEILLDFFFFFDRDAWNMWTWPVAFPPLPAFPFGLFAPFLFIQSLSDLAAVAMNQTLPSQRCGSSSKRCMTTPTPWLTTPEARNRGIFIFFVKKSTKSFRKSQHWLSEKSKQLKKVGIIFLFFKHVLCMPNCTSLCLHSFPPLPLASLKTQCVVMVQKNVGWTF